MKAPRNRIFGWSWLGVVNFGFFQWFFVRLQGQAEALHNGERIMWLSWIGPIVPLTGWWSHYLYVYCLPESKNDLAVLKAEIEKMRTQLETHSIEERISAFEWFDKVDQKTREMVIENLRSYAADLKATLAPPGSGRKE